MAATIYKRIYISILMVLTPLPMQALGAVIDCSRTRELEELSDQGKTDSQRELAKLYLRGECVPKDLKKGSNLLIRAATSGDLRSQLGLASLLEEGGAHLEAATWFKKAADQSSPEAEAMLGVLYERGTGVPQSDKTAETLFRQSAEQGNYLGQMSLAKMYLQGKGGLLQSDVEADKWYILSAKALGSDHQYVRDVRQILESRMSQSQIDEAVKLSNEWQPIGRTQ